MNVAAITTMGTKASTLRTAVAAQMNQIRILNYMRLPAFISPAIDTFCVNATSRGFFPRLCMPCASI